jgi:hypothetical protein
MRLTSLGLALTGSWSRLWHLAKALKPWIEPIFPFWNMGAALYLYSRFFGDWFRYQHLPNAEPLRVRDSYPHLFDAVRLTPYDSHYLYQAVWAMERIASCRPELHVDVGSDVGFVGMLTTHVPTSFVDIRPLTAKLSRFNSVAGSLLTLPFANDAATSMSCLHVAEHIGLGRYGDPLDPQGTRKAARELVRVLARRGNLFFSLPVGRPRVCFNAHRVHSPQQILDYFYDLELVEFSAVDDDGHFHRQIDPIKLVAADYACGMFHFTKRL